MRHLTCIICPRGCTLTVDNDLKVLGNICPRGEKYAIAECTAPMRTVTATVRVHNREDMMLPVKTEQPVPKEKMLEVMTALRSMTVDAPIAPGSVIIPDIFGTKIIATGKVE